MLKIEVGITSANDKKKYYVKRKNLIWLEVDVVDTFEIFERFTVFARESEVGDFLDFSDHITGCLVSANKTKAEFLENMNDIGEDIYEGELLKAISKYDINTNMSRLPISPAYKLNFKTQ